MDALRAAMSFQGRINRARYWLISVLGGLAMVVGVFAAFTPLVGPVITAVVVVGALVASTSASVRRMHDRGRSGWWLLLAYVPLFLLGGAKRGHAHWRGRNRGHPAEFA